MRAPPPGPARAPRPRVGTGVAGPPSTGLRPAERVRRHSADGEQTVKAGAQSRLAAAAATSRARRQGACHGGAASAVRLAHEDAFAWTSLKAREAGAGCARQGLKRLELGQQPPQLVDLGPRRVAAYPSRVKVLPSLVASLGVRLGPADQTQQDGQVSEIQGFHRSLLPLRRRCRFAPATAQTHGHVAAWPRVPPQNRAGMAPCLPAARMRVGAMQRIKLMGRKGLGTGIRCALSEGDSTCPLNREPGDPHRSQGHWNCRPSKLELFRNRYPPR